MTNGSVHNGGRSFAELLTEFKEELKEFANTRFQMLRAELTEKAGAWKAAVPMLAICGVLLLFAFMLLTGALVALIALAFANHPWAYALSFAIVGVIYLLAGGAAGAYGYRTIKANGMAPERTMRILKQDQVWLQTEARTQL
ncbi:MAG TPA: phage holin family protein [Clostridia bacterium]|nr:phage holin family protein [Clostridia bacterium]